MTTIRRECLNPAESWARPTGQEISEVLRLTGLSGGQASKNLGLQNSRTIRKWIGEDSEIPYAAWALLCDLAGLGIIWRDSKQTAEPAFVMPESLSPELIKQTREQAGLTQTQAAKLIYKGLRTWQGWETSEELVGHRKMDPALFELFKIKIAALNN
jgi:DNA-binding XRE family transcriptional regulator